MPLLELSSEEALGNRKSNRQGGWGDRSRANRVEPVCKPAFDVPFHLKPEDRIFTIGSCFARNVEQALAERGFHLPMLDVFRKPEFAKTSPGILNNYATPSIYNEIAWAFDEDYYPREHLITEISSGKFVDLNLTPNLRPDTREVVEYRRAAIRQAYRSSAGCEVIIITLGLSEVWFDSLTKTYLNVSPRPAMLRDDPTRFRLHVLSYAETFEYLQKAVHLLRKHGRSDQNIILTVSPVPLVRTHRSQDVILANTYSKSVLRAAVEEISASHSSITYFPSFESFVLSDRNLAFVDDMIHTQMDLVSFNVGRMVDAFTGKDETLLSLQEAVARGGELVAVDKASSIAPELADAFFEQHGEWSTRSLRFAKEHARYLIKARRFVEAAEVLAKHELGSDLEHLTLCIKALSASGEPDKALALINYVPTTKVRAGELWANLLAAAISVGDPMAVLAILARVKTDVKSFTPTAYLQAARFFRNREDYEKAAELYEAASSDGAVNAVNIEYAELLLLTGKHEKARRTLSLLEAMSPEEQRRVDQLSIVN